MIRKWMTTLLAMLLAMMLPLCALADTQHTLTILPGDALATEQAAGAVYCGGSDGGAYRDADIGTAMTMARLEDIDRFFRRDSRRYDSGF